MGMDVAGRLKEYAKTHVENINKEYMRQIGKWKDHLNFFADAQVTARQHVEKTLDEIKSQSEAMNRIIMLASSVLLSGVAAWVGAVIELQLYPRYTGKLVFKDAFENGRYIPRSKYVSYDEVAAKFFGDFTHENLGHAFDSILEKVWPTSRGRREPDDALRLSVASGNIGTFKSNLEKAISDEAGVVIGQLGTLSGNINKYNSPDGWGFGEVIVREVLRRFPRMKGVSNDVADRAVELNGQRLLDEYFDKLRQTYSKSKSWFYYGNNPRPESLHNLPFYFEIETWALWLLIQEWRPKYIDTTSDYPGVSYIWGTKADEDISLDQVMQALHQLALRREFWGYLRPLPIKPLGKPIKPLGKQPGWVQEIEPKPLGKKGGWVQEIDVDAEDADRAARTLGKTAKFTGDEDKDMTRMLAWAKSIPGTRLRGVLDYVPRRIGSVADPASMFAD